MPRSKHSKVPRRNARVKWGRIQLLALFAVLEGLDVMLYASAAGTPEVMQRRLLGAALIWTVWSTVCVIAMWNRQNWARYLLFIWLLFSVLVSALLELAYSDRIAAMGGMAWAVGITAGHLIVALVLMASPQIRKLTKPDNHFDFY